METHKNEVHASTYETILSHAHANSPGRMGAKINIKDLAIALAKATPTILDVARIAGLPVPSNADDIARFVLTKFGLI